MPKLQAVEAYWGVEADTCIRCRRTARCERAHVITRCFGGSDDVDNLVPLCVPCHKRMMWYEPGEEDEARAWLACASRGEWLQRIAAALMEQYPAESAAAEAADTLEAAENFVRSHTLDYSKLPQIQKAEA